VLPLNDADGIFAGDDEDLELREAMNDQLARIVADDEFGVLSSRHPMVVEISGTPAGRLATLNAAESLARVNELARRCGQ
jgi:hypothetical protein